MSEPVAIVKKKSIKNNIQYNIKKMFNKNTKGANAIQTSIADKKYDKKKKNEIFVDVYEKISVLFNSSGYTINSAIDGCI